MEMKKEIFLDDTIEKDFVEYAMRKIGNHSNAQFFIGDLSQEKVIKSKQLLEDEGFIVSVDSRIMTIYRKNNTRTIISDPYDFLYRSRRLMEIAGIFEGSSCTDGLSVVNVKGLFYNDRTKEFYYGYVNRFGDSYIMEYNEFVSRYKPLEKESILND